MGKKLGELIQLEQKKLKIESLESQKFFGKKALQFEPVLALLNDLSVELKEEGLNMEIQTSLTNASVRFENFTWNITIKDKSLLLAERGVQLEETIYYSWAEPENQFSLKTRIFKNAEQTVDYIVSMLAKKIAAIRGSKKTK